MVELSVLYKNGEGVEKNLKMANYWMKKAVENGHVEKPEEYIYTLRKAYALFFPFVSFSPFFALYLLLIILL